MSSITLQEKKVIMQSLHEKIDTRIKFICQNNPTYEHEIQEKARLRAHKQYGIDQKKRLYSKAIEKMWKAKDEVEELYCELVGQVSGKDSKEVKSSATSYNTSHISLSRLDSFSQTIETYAEKDISFYLDQVMMENEIGREIKMLKDQKKYVDDAIMLATTSAKLYPLYERVLQAIGDKETSLLTAGMQSNGRQEGKLLNAPKS